ncbi:MAG: hypothetical protein P1P84_00680 [Deferrisomatales bacterium]|nr:hypothetical protein [Deferrisomatales bacterium]
MTNGIVASPPPQPTPFRQTERLQEALSYRSESTDVRYTDADGRSFNLSLRTESISYAMTYDRAAQVRGGSPPEIGHREHEPAEGPRRYGRGRHREIRKELRELHEEFHDLEKALKQSGIEVEAFSKMLHRMLKSVDRGYRDHFRYRDPLEGAIVASEQVHVEAAAVGQTATLAMDDVDPVYWNVENTVQRLVDFATGLYREGDRGEHVDKMVAAMQRGYAEAAQAFGGALPEIADDTIELAVQRLEEWAAGDPAQEPVLDLVA